MYDKPKVTIDLDEYNSLIDEKNRISSDENVLLTKTVLATFINYNMNVREASEKLNEMGILFSVTMSNAQIEVTPKDILIAKIKNHG